MRTLHQASAALLLTAASFASAQSFSSSSGPAADAPAEPREITRAPGPIADTVRPFHAIAFALKAGTGGLGVDIATPLNSHMNLRGGAQFFDHTVNIKSDGIQTAGDITLQNIAASVDIFPFRHSGFRISPGITLHNDNHVAGPLTVAGGQSFSLGDQDYTSDPNDPIRGQARITFGNSVAPRLTVGWGNMIPRNGGRFSIPFEAGFQYSGAPTVDIALAGSACTNEGCASLSEGDGPQNLKDEIVQLQNDLKPLRFFPIVSIGISFRFGSTNTSTH